MKFLIDENLPKSLSQELREKKIEVIDLKEIGKIGITDQEVIEVANLNNCVLITANYKHFGNIIMFPPQNCPGIIVVRMPMCSIKMLVERVINVILSRKEEEFGHSLTVIEFSRIRVRR